MKWSADITFMCRIARTQNAERRTQNAERRARSNLKPVQSVVEWIAFQFNE